MFRVYRVQVWGFLESGLGVGLDIADEDVQSCLSYWLNVDKRRKPDCLPAPFRILNAVDARKLVHSLKPVGAHVPCGFFDLCHSLL